MGLGTNAAATGRAELLALPGTCKLAIIHTGLVCSGQSPEYVAIPGFAPLRYSWGWLLLGIFLGGVFSVLILSLIGCLRREPTIAALAAVAHAAPVRAPDALPRLQRPPPGLPAPRDRAREDIVAFLAQDGRGALTDLAAASGLSETDFLLTVFSEGPRRGVLDRH